MARITEGDGLTKKIKPIKMIAVTAIRNFIRRMNHCASQSMKAATIAKFSPLTAVRWVRPTRRIWVTNDGFSKLVSPITKPGIRSPLSLLNRFADLEKLLRIPAATCKIGLAVRNLVKAP